MIARVHKGMKLRKTEWRVVYRYVDDEGRAYVLTCTVLAATYDEAAAKLKSEMPSIEILMPKESA